QIQHTFARALSNRGELARAIGHFQCALVQSPSSPELLTDYAVCLRKLKRLPGALRAVDRALALAQDSAVAHRERSAVLTEQGNFDQAQLSAERALALKADYPEAWCELAAALVFNGQLAAGLTAYRRAIALEPNNALTHSNLAFLLAFDPSSSAQAILNEVEDWARRHAAPFARYQRAHRHTPDPERKLRLGYVSSNFNDHCQALFTLPLLDAHDRTKFELHAFSALSSADRVTARLAAKFDHWTDISGLDAIEAADRIRSREIDILIDLTMHMSTTQLRIFACKPAPVQIAWLAYPGTTGLPTIDYRITDRYLDPTDRPSDPYSEESLVLPDTFWCYQPGVELPVADLPARGKGHVTFGCLNSFWKLNDVTLRLWATVLERVPGSHLLLLAPEGSARARVLATLELAGIAAERIEFSSRRPRAQYLQLYDQIDICLDALPYNGHTTSLDAFWMGVPVLTLVGQTVVGRAGRSQAMNLGLPELIALTPEVFAAKAAELAGDLDALAELRSGLRQRLERSPLMDAASFARNLEAKYREGWQRWCAGVERPVAVSEGTAR
ncbi:MAG TPA: tetratricopeptide repeat protein, partial [Polyangiaceae bacterium]